MIVHTSQGKFNNTTRQKYINITSSSKTHFLYELLQKQGITCEGELMADIENILMDKVARNNFKLSFRNYSKLSNITVVNNGNGNNIEPRCRIVLLEGHLYPPDKSIGQYSKYIARESIFKCTLKNVILKVEDDHIKIIVSEKTIWKS